MKLPQFTIRDVLWLTLVGGCLVGWYLDHSFRENRSWRTWTSEMNKRIHFQMYYEQLVQQVSKAGLKSMSQDNVQSLNGLPNSHFEF